MAKRGYRSGIRASWQKYGVIFPYFFCLPIALFVLVFFLPALSAELSKYRFVVYTLVPIVSGWWTYSFIREASVFSVQENDVNTFK